jgi:hypothetical protein
VGLQVDASVLEEHTAPIFSTEDENRMFLQNVGITYKSKGCSIQKINKEIFTPMRTSNLS